MGQNVVFVTAAGYPNKIPHTKYCLNTWEWWCNKHGAFLFVWDPKPEDYYPMRPTWLRYSAFQVLDDHNIRFDRVALVDADTMVNWDCPDFFRLVGNSLGAVRDGKRPRWTQKSIKSFQHLFPDVRLQIQDYFNAGFLILNKTHRFLFQEMLDFYGCHGDQIREIIRRTQKGTDQTLLNFMVKKNGYSLHYLSYEFNAMHFIPQMFHNRFLFQTCGIHVFLKKGKIRHFAGIRKNAIETIMRATWNSIKGHYSE